MDGSSAVRSTRNSVNSVPTRSAAPDPFAARPRSSQAEMPRSLAIATNSSALHRSKSSAGSTCSTMFAEPATKSIEYEFDHWIICLTNFRPDALNLQQIEFSHTQHKHRFFFGADSCGAATEQILRIQRSILGVLPRRRGCVVLVIVLILVLMGRV
jgi:hypothetical protein